MSCCRSCIDCLPVLAVLALFAYVYYTYVVVLCMHTLEYLVQRIIYSLIFHIFFFMALLSYFITMCKEHEYVPSYYKLPTMDYEMFKIAGTEDEKNRILDGFCRSRAIRIYTTTATGAIRKVVSQHCAHKNELDFTDFALNASTSSLIELTIVLHARHASQKWTITVRG